MFNRGNSPRPPRSGGELPTTILGEDTRWEGEIQAGKDGLRVDGEVEGTILSQGHVVISSTGHVMGTIHARNLTVMGRAEGFFKVEGCLEIHGAGWVEGDVELGVLVVDEGGMLQGTCHLGQPSKASETRKEGGPQDYSPLPATGSRAPLVEGRGPSRNRL
jgi:cytoskeletal protein CcmA (bactofilin family)